MLNTALCRDGAGAIHMEPSTAVLGFGAAWAQWMAPQCEAMCHEELVVASVTASMKAISRSRETLERCAWNPPMRFGSIT
jgi:hypothetical protein